MENYPILFPPSSSSVSPPSSSSTVSYLSSSQLLPNMMMNPQIFTGFHGNSTGFLGLKREADTQIPDHQIENFNGSQNGERPDKKKGGKKAKKPRYAFETRSQVDILDDGYRWRKYGQKAVKNNRFPRSYYRCTHQGCNVKKQVQRLSKDEGVVVTTYEGIHTHPIERSTDNFEHILSQMQIYSTI